MKRRTLLLGTAGIAAAAGASTLLWRPEDRGGPHDAYFSRLNELLKRDGPGRPVMLINRQNRAVWRWFWPVAHVADQWKSFRHEAIERSCIHPRRMARFESQRGGS